MGQGQSFRSGIRGCSARMADRMKSSGWTPAFCIALLIGGCAKRQSGTRLVYVAAPPPATTAEPASDSATLVIEEPAAPEPEEAPVAEPPPPAPLPKASPPKTRRPGGPAESAPTQPPAEEPSVEPPPLEPANNPGQGRQQLEKTQQDMGLRIAQFERTPLSDAERRTLAEAQAFLDQSRRALNEGDLPRAKNLADKARLLVTAFEQRH